MTIAPPTGNTTTKSAALRGGFLFWSARCRAQRAEFVSMGVLAIFLTKFDPPGAWAVFLKISRKFCAFCQ